MNQLELMANSRASQRFTRNFNEDPSLRELSTGSFDAVPPRQWSCGALMIWWVCQEDPMEYEKPLKTKIFFLKIGWLEDEIYVPKCRNGPVYFGDMLIFRGSILD